MLNISVDSVVKALVSKKNNVVSLLSRSSKDQRCPNNHNKSGSHFQRQESLFQCSFNTGL